MQNLWLYKFQIPLNVLQSLWLYLTSGKVLILIFCGDDGMHIVSAHAWSVHYFISAIEYFSWLLYYVPILHDVMSDEYYNHYCLHILLSDNITEDMLLLAEESLHKFYLQYPNLYST